MRRLVRREPALPVLDQVLPGVDGLAERAQRLLRDIEALIWIPAVCLLRQADLVRAERRAVRLLRVLLVRAAEADVRPDRDQARPVVGAGGLDGRRYGRDVVA